MSLPENERLEIRLFGHFEVRRGDAPIPTAAWGRKKTRQLLKLLLTEPGRVFPVDQLIDNLYEQQQPDRVIKNLRGRISELRQALEPDLPKGQDSQLILNANGGYLFISNANCWVDTMTFHEFLDQANSMKRDEQWESALQAYEEAIKLYAGDFLAEDIYEEWTEPTRTSWREAYLDALLQTAECQAKIGHYDDAIRHLRLALEIEPHRERAYRHLMVYHSWANERDMALRIYHECVDALSEYLDVEPSIETQVVYQHIQSDKLPKPQPHVPNNLPDSPTAFVGRDEELAELGEYLRDPECRLLSLIGPGGIGKTRLAFQTAKEQLAQFRDGVFVVALAPLHSGDSISECAAQVLEFPLSPGENATEQILEHLSNKNILLILDNLEHVQQESEDWITEILQGTSHVKILATSRGRLHLTWDHPWHVKGLSCPPQSIEENEAIEHYEAVKLFLQTAQRVAPGYELIDVERTHVIQLCRLLEGMPLGIKLAASWISTHSCREIVAQVKQQTDVVSPGHITSKIAPNDLETQQRHRSLRAAFEWSWQLLSGADQAVLMRLAVFRGDFNKEAAQHVADAMPMSLSSLIDKSLLQRESAERFNVHEAIREFLTEKLRKFDEYDATAREHGSYYLSFLTDRNDALESSEKETVDEIVEELEEIRAAWSWAITSDQRLLDLAVGPLSHIYEIRSLFHAGCSALRQALDCISDTTATTHRLWVRHGRFCMRLGHHDEALASLEEGLRLARDVNDELEIAHALRALGLLAQEKGDYRLAEEHLRAALELYEKLGNDRGIANALHGLSLVAYWRGEFEQGYKDAMESLVRFEELLDQRSTAMALDILGLLANKQGQDSEAEGYFRQCLVIHRDLGDRRRLATGLSHLGITLYHQGKYEQAKEQFVESLTVSRELGQRLTIALLLNNLGNLSRKLGQYDEANEYLDESLSLLRELDSTWHLANTLANLGTVAIAQRKLSLAQKYLHEALTFGLEIESKPIIFMTLIRLAQLDIAEKSLPRALKILSFVSNQPELSSWAKKRSEQLLTDLRSDVSDSKYAELLESGASYELNDLVKELVSGKS